MSHFSVSVIVPHDYSNSHVTANDIENCLHRILAPYDEQTEEAEYREFDSSERRWYQTTVEKLYLRSSSSVRYRTTTFRYRWARSP